MIPISPNKILNAGRAAYVERNYHMIDRADICIFYLDKTYSPLNGQPSNNHLASGTKLAYNYAIFKKKVIINLYCDTQ